MAGKYPGIQKRFEAGGFGALWRYAKGHGLKRWIKLRNWSRKRVAHAQDPSGFKKELELDNKKIAHLRKLKHETKPDGNCIVAFDGKPCASWIAVDLTRARKTDIWKGVLLSGVRTIAESIGLCRAMCGADSCAGRCAGATSRHACDNCCSPNGAADCTDPAGLAAALRTLGNTDLIGDGRVLPADINHFSHYGN